MTVSTSEAWQRLQAQGARLAASHLRDLFAADPQRVERLSADFDGLHLDYSKQRVNAEAMDGLVALAEAAARLQESREAEERQRVQEAERLKEQERQQERLREREARDHDRDGGLTH